MTTNDKFPFLQNINNFSKKELYNEFNYEFIKKNFIKEENDYRYQVDDFKIGKIWNHPTNWRDIHWESWDTQESVRKRMLVIPTERLREAFEHYYDLWTWEGGEDNRKLMEAFEAEIKSDRMLDTVEAMTKKKIHSGNPTLSIPV